jgi:outer membrane protein assembly factor BamB
VPGAFSSPLVVDNLVYVAIQDPALATTDAANAGWQVWALDRRSGGTIWGPSAPAGADLTYDAGRVFARRVTNGHTLIAAFDASSGAALWSTQLQYDGFYTAPTALNGMVFVTGPRTVAIDAASGNVVWQAGGRWMQSPAVTTAGVYVSDGCGNATDYDFQSGAVVWSASSSCQSAEAFAVYHAGRLYAGLVTGADSSVTYVFDASSGASMGTVPSPDKPVFEGNQGFYTRGGGLHSFDATTGTVGWTAGLGEGLFIEPLAINGNVYGYSTNGYVYVVRESDGTPLGSFRTGDFNGRCCPPPTVMLAGSGAVAIADGNSLFLMAAAAATPGPVVTFTTPFGGPVGGGTQVTITGTHLGQATGVRFGQQPAATFSVLSDSTITAVSPAGIEGYTPVIVDTPKGATPSAEQLQGNFTYFRGPDAVDDQATALGNNPLHSGSVADNAFTIPTRRRWVADTGGQISYPLIAGGRVYVLVINGSTRTLRAFASSDGSTAWSTPVSANSNALAYDGGRVFVTDDSETVSAFDAGTGLPLWIAPLQASNTTDISPPTARNGLVLVNRTGEIVALNATTGTVAWTRPLSNQGYSGGTPAISNDAVYVGCGGGTKLRLSDGSVVWSHATGSCDTAGSVFGDRFYEGSMTSGGVDDAVSGEPIAKFDLNTPFTGAYDGNRGYFAHASQNTAVSQLSALDLATGVTAWNYIGDTSMGYAPLVVNGVVYSASVGGHLYAVSAGTGALLWTDDMGQPLVTPIVATFKHRGMAVGEGLLVVPDGNDLIAYDSVSTETAASLNSDHSLLAFSSSRGWHNLGGYLAGPPAVLSLPLPDGTPRTLFLGTGSDGNLWVRTETDSWQPLTAMAPMKCRDGPALAVYGGVLYIACEGQDRTLWYGTAAVDAGLPSSPAGSWRSLGGGLTSGPAVSPVGTGLVFFAVGSDQHVWTRSPTSGWTSTPWSCVARPAVTALAGTTSLACQGIDGSLEVTRTVNGRWTALQSLGGRLVGAPGQAVSSAGTTFYVQGIDGQVWTRRHTPGRDFGWASTGIQAFSGMGAAADEQP